MKYFDVIIVGAGPAGIAAATAAARHGRTVLLLDDNPAVGGQIWRSGIEASAKPTDNGERAKKTKTLQQLASSGAILLTGYRVFDAPAPRTLHALRETEDDVETVALRYGRLILATGARERFLPFPGWTLPGVFGAGGLQGARQRDFPVGGKRAVVAGSGPLLLAVAVHLHEYGADVTSTSPGTGEDIAANSVRRLAVVSSRKGLAGYEIPSRTKKNSLPNRLLAGHRTRKRQRPGCSTVSA